MKIELLSKEGLFYLKTFIICSLILFGALILAKAEEVNIEALTNAIYKAEGGSKTKYPYGILTKYKHTTARQACVNTIKHALRDWNRKDDFIAFLGSRYCPIGAKNDLQGLNKHWIKNVKYFYAKEVR